VDRACTCRGGESPLWVAVAQRETELVEELLAAGADPDTTAFAGSSALEVARRRGYDDIAARLLTAGVQPAADDHWIAPAGPAAATGIKAIDLWCPLPERGLVHLTPGFGLGAIVLVSELSYRSARRGRPVVWTGFVQAPTDLGDVHHALAESGLAETITLAMAAPSADLDEQLAALDVGLAAAGDDAFLVVFAETGRMRAIDERLAALAARNAVTLVVAPLDGSVRPPDRDGTPYAASIVFDVERATRGQWPAVGADSWSKVAGPELAALADRARAAIAGGALQGLLHEYLCQPFFVAEPVMGRPGESVTLDGLQAEVARLVR
jgi:hypothetical protein